MTTMQRPEQLAIEGFESRPVGFIPASVMTGSNADVIETIAPLYLTGSVCDLTYGRGMWWRRFRPDPFVMHDIDTTKGDGVDFRHLPEADGTYDAVTFDPPYIAPGGLSTSTVPEYRDGFGLDQRSTSSLWLLIGAGLYEAARVTKRGGFVLAKCMDAVDGSRLDLGHVRMIELGRLIGLQVHDLIVHVTGSGPGGHNIRTVLRCRRHHSYLIVFRVGGGRR